MLIAKMEDIIIPDWFKERSPKAEKIAECVDFYTTYGFQDRLITIDSRGVLTDGYIMYLVLKMFDVKYAEVQRKGKRKFPNRRKIDIFNPKEWYGNCPTVYVFGVHINGTDDKERVWRVPAGKMCDMHVGDCVMAHVFEGKAPIKITRIALLDKPPVDMKVKTICYINDEESEKVKENVEMVKSA